MGFLIRNQRQPKKFGLEHRIYDERKHAIKVKMTAESDIELLQTDKDAYRAKMRERIGRYSNSSKSSMNKNFRIIRLFTVLTVGLAIVAAFYYLLGLLPAMLEN